ncbi:hypothetical protein PN465_09120 [Nodularia spumigena CS-584]|jgi:hypothetical protein|uniref:Uncharacterized protein n=1 Tax=Nodularia spumigena UHCC 0060 TaxID=3110300 RepID=A0ABU5UU23_NODSP|nr:hypothetical protein [Nodularia spumigena]AHJ31565.1 hypothetical protein NSP_52770 [Nodularia spumigena CCY9414]EAW46902.1 hypothetical protein N9414_24233 [Nodularia spumigena CCY9414]MDB9382382.1 hypothetical protein [Nodularia spumigena CS-584]MEA5524803.1 hypothetical protein [Nodularia spumigena UHCC 0143]MEA5556915.1 hypothetical protein [Nodularia spumigena CH309]
MTLLSHDELKILVDNSQSPCVSLYMPMQKAGPEIRQNPIRLKNLIREAEERLYAMGMRHTEAIDFLQPAKELDTTDFWQNQDNGLAIFISPQMFRYYRLPMEFQELVVVSVRFHLKPLLHLINSDGHFYLLALSQKDIKFFEGTAYSLNEVEVANMPGSIDAALLQDDIQKGVQHRIGTPRGGTANSFQQPGDVHGQGSPDRDKHQADILQFCHIIDRAVHEKIRGDNAPLMLAGVEYLFPIYQEANTYPYFLESGITGNTEVMKPEELHKQAWPIVEPLFHENQQSAMALYQQRTGTGTTSSDIKEIVSATYCQRVDSMFVPIDMQIWGKFDPDTMTVDVHSEPEPDDEDMLDLAAIQTVINGGKVYTVESEQMPNGTPVAAIFRY